MWKRVAFGTPKNNEIVPQPLRNCSHQAKPKKAASGAHPKKQRPSRFCVQAIAGVQPQKSRNVAFGTPKNNENVLLLEPLKTMKSCPSHCETAATRQSPRKLRRERIRKSRAPAGFASKPLQEYSLKNLETLLLEPLKTMWKRVAFGTPKNNEIVPQPLRNCSHSPSRFCVQAIANCNLKNLETLLLEPLKTMKSCPSYCETSATRQESCVGSASEKAEPQQVLRPSHCGTATSKISKRFFWNP